MSIESPSSAGLEARPDDGASSTAVWLPWAIVAALAGAITATVLVTANGATEPVYPHQQLDHPIGAWVFAYAFPAIWFGLLALFATQAARTRMLSMPALLFAAGTTMFWIEWPADWGSYLVYNRDFWALPGWTSTWYQTYWKPVGVIFGYGVFFAVECIILLKVVPRVSGAVQRIVPRVSPTAVLIASCAAVFYTVDILGERLMTALGWYSYVEPVGPAWTSAHGSISFVWPAIPFLLFAVTITLVLRQDTRGNYPNEKLFRVHTLAPGPQREAARLAVWIITMNVAIFVAQPLILCVGRTLFLHASVYNP